MKTRLLLLALSLTFASAWLHAANSAASKVANLTTEVQALQNQIASQPNGPTESQQAQLSGLLSNLSNARQDVNNSISLLNDLLSQAGQQGVGGLPSNNTGQVGGPTITEGPDANQIAAQAAQAAKDAEVLNQATAAAKRGDTTALAQLAKNNPDKAEAIAKAAATAAPDAAATIAATIAAAVPSSATKVATAAAVAANAAQAVAKDNPYQVSLIAAAVAKAVPGSAVEVAKSVTHAVPTQAAAIAVSIVSVAPTQAAAIAGVVASQISKENAGVIAAVVASVAPAGQTANINAAVATSTSQTLTVVQAGAANVSTQIKTEALAWGQGAAEAGKIAASTGTSAAAAVSQGGNVNQTTPATALVDPAIVSRSS